MCALVHVCVCVCVVIAAKSVAVIECSTDVGRAKISVGFVRFWCVCCRISWCFPFTLCLRDAHSDKKTTSKNGESRVKITTAIVCNAGHNEWWFYRLICSSFGRQQNKKNDFSFVVFVGLRLNEGHDNEKCNCNWQQQHKKRFDWKLRESHHWIVSIAL